MMTTKPRILVTTAAGKTGTAVTHQLLEKGYPVNAFVRRHDHRSEALAKAGARVFVGNFIEPDDLRQAMQGVQRAYYCAPWTSTQLHGAMKSLKEIIDSNASIPDKPELFCFGLLESFDIKQLAALVAPRPVSFMPPRPKNTVH